LGVAFGVEEGADVVQEAFIAAERRWGRVRGSEDPAGWVRRVALNRLLNGLQRVRLPVRRRHPHRLPAGSPRDHPLPLRNTRPFGATPVTLTVAGTSDHEACYFGHPGDRFWVTADDIASPVITRPTTSRVSAPQHAAAAGVAGHRAALQLVGDGHGGRVRRGSGISRRRCSQHGPGAPTEDGVRAPGP
jgi:hypothetical protein